MFADFEAAQAAMVHDGARAFAPDPDAHAVYNELYGIYRELHDAFGGVAGARERPADADEARARCARARNGAASTWGNVMLAADLRERVCRANKDLAASGLVVGTFGNVSAADYEQGLLVIKPSGVPYEALTPAHMVPVSLETGEVVDGTWRPSSDTATHLALCRAFRCGAVVHTHSEFATAFAQARLAIPCLGTTHADYFGGDIPVTREMTSAEVDGDYEHQTGAVIVETFRAAGIDPHEVPAVLVANHGPFTWGPTRRRRR